MDNLKEEKGLFLGPKKIGSVDAEDFKTRGGNSTVTVKFENGDTQFMPKKSYDLLVMDNPTDFTNLGNRKLAIILDDLISTLMEHDLRGEDVNPLVNRLQNRLADVINKAIHILWTGELKSFVPGDNVTFERSILDADKIIESIKENGQSEQPKKEDN